MTRAINSLAHRTFELPSAAMPSAIFPSRKRRPCAQLFIFVGFSQVGCRIFTTRMSDFYNSDVGFLQVGCRISKLCCLIFTTRMSDFHKSDVGFLQLGCRIFTTLLSDFQQLGWHLQASVVGGNSSPNNIVVIGCDS